MKSLKTMLTAVAASLALSASSYAGPILVAEWAGGSGDATELAAVNTAIANYNTANNPDLPALGAEFVAKTTSIGSYAPGDGQTINWTAPSDFAFYYIMTKWGAGGASFDHALHYVLAGETLVYNPDDLLKKGDAPNGLSHLWIWGGGENRVPDGGSTVALLGAALAGVSMIRRKK
jgi:hypothetical protein